MSKLQIFSSYDELKTYKEIITNIYDNCILRHDNVNRTFYISNGKNDEDYYCESIITDGDISIVDENINNPYILWKDELIKLEQYKSFSIKLIDASFFINIIEKNNEYIYEIHTLKNDENLYNTLINYLYKKIVPNMELNEISFINDNIIRYKSNINKDFSISFNKSYKNVK